MKPGPILLWTLASLVVVAGAYAGACWVVLKTLIVPERKPHAESPADLGFPGARSLTFESRTGAVPLRGWLIPSRRERAVILVHGLHSHAWDCGTPDLVAAYAEAGFDVFLFDLRGHGASGGEHAGLGLLERGDVRAAVDLLLERGIEPGRIGIHGVSYGAAVALMAAARIDAIGAVIADSSYASFADALGAELERRTGLPPTTATILMPGLDLLASAIYGVDPDEAAPAQAIARIQRRPILLIHGTEDWVIPYEHAERLQAAAGPNASLWSLSGAEHTQGIRTVPDCAAVSPLRDAYLSRGVRFFERHLEAETARRPVDPARPAAASREPGFAQGR